MISNLTSFFGFKSNRTLWVIVASVAATLALVFITTALISTGAKSDSMPQLEGLTTDEVSVIAEEHHLAVTYVWVNSNAPKGEVTGHEPAAGSPLLPGSTVKVFLSKGNNEDVPVSSKSQKGSTPSNSETTNQQSGGAPVTNKQAPSSANNLPAQTAPKKASPPDPTRPWLTQEQIDANVAQRAEIVNRFNNQRAYVQSLQAARDAKQAEKWAICNPPVREGYNFQPCLDLDPVIAQMNAEIDSQLRVLESINAELQNGTWY